MIVLSKLSYYAICTDFNSDFNWKTDLWKSGPTALDGVLLSGAALRASEEEYLSPHIGNARIMLVVYLHLLSCQMFLHSHTETITSHNSFLCFL